MTRPSQATADGRAYLDLQNLARGEKRSTQGFLVLYVLELLPGQRLKFPDLAERYQASIGVIREALIRLVERGLVRSEAHLGFRVAPLSEQGHAELADARLVVEVLVLQRAIADGDLEWETRLVAAHHRFERTPRADPQVPGKPSNEWVVAHAEFHRALLDGCGNRRLFAMAITLREEAELYRRWCHLPAGTSEVPADLSLPEEHRALLDAALTRDLDAAAERLGALIRRTLELRLDVAVSGLPPR